MVLVRHGVKFSLKIMVSKVQQKLQWRATFGLVLGGLIGGPVARFLTRNIPTPGTAEDDKDVPTAFEKPQSGRMITSMVLIETIALIAICLLIGSYIAGELADTPLHCLNLYVYCLLVLF